VKVVPELFNMITREVGFETIGPVTVAKLRRPALAPGQKVLKRIEDIVVSIALGIVFLPVSIAIAVAIKLEDGGPVLFRQDRLGVGGGRFRLYKFRSMRVDTDEAEHRDAVASYVDGTAEDPEDVYRMVKGRSVTRVGRWIRRYSLDEIPQFWNVLKGEMSVVGPRPPLAYEHAQYSEFYKKRLLLKPGITGMWQVSADRYEMGFDQLVLMDVRYINEWSLWLDIKILLETVVHLVRGQGV
jgi:lipopolysaccharide/colanic/teichoic acid biosynthesis glycosyltransferase